MKKAIYFYQYLPPWRIDVFNEIATHYDLTIVFTDAESEGFTYDRIFLLSKLKNIKTIFLNNGFKIGTRPIRFGIYDIIKNIDPDIVFSHEYSPTSILIAFYRQINLFNYKYVITTSDNLKMAEDVKGLKKICRKYILNHADGIVVYSKSVQDWYQNKFANIDVKICPNIQDPKTLLNYVAAFPPIIEKYRHKYHLDGKKIMLFVGRLVHVKGVDLLIESFSKFNNDYVLVIVGEGILESKLKELVSRLGIERKVIFAGSYSGPELYVWYQMANFFILPSRYEPFGAVINESLVYGCPVVASRHMGAVDFVNDTNGILFDPLDKDEFIETLNVAFNKYKLPNQGKNLMIHSFENYVKVFKEFNL